MNYEQRMELAKQLLNSAGTDNTSQLITHNDERLKRKAQRGSRVAAKLRQQRFVESEIDQEGEV